MKKFLAVIALVLVASMMLVTPAFAEDERTPDYKRDYGQDTFYAKKMDKAPIIDGDISAEEWGEPTVSKTEPNYWQSLSTDDTYSKYTEDDPRELEERTAQKLDFYFGYDDNYIYIAYYQLGAGWDANNDGKVGKEFNEYNFRNNYMMRMGFDIEDVSNLMQLGYGMPDIKDGYGPITSDASASHSGGRISFTCGMPYASDASAAMYDGANILVEGKISKKEAATGNPINGCNSITGQYVECFEIMLDKQNLLDAYNEVCETEYAELPNAMFFTFQMRQYGWSEDHGKGVAYNGQTAWFGTPLDLDQQLDLDNLFEYFPDIVVFGDKIEDPIHIGDVTEPPVTEAPTTEPETTVPVETEPESEAEATESAEVDTQLAPEGGCGGSVSFAGLALVASLGACAVVTTKKRRK